MSKRSGFSLIEVAIVVLIVGFLVAAATVGMSLAKKMQATVDNYQAKNVPAEDRRTGFKSIFSAPIQCEGGSITTVNGKTIHTFTSGTGTFKCPSEKTVNVLVVGGGGGGGGVNDGNAGGGGGAGALVYIENYSIAAETNYDVLVGASVSASTTGKPSSFGTITAIGGGRGVMYAPTSTDGGSGGGAASNSSANRVGVALDPTRGNNGGRSANNGIAAQSFSGGGGGACAPGGNATAGAVGVGVGGNGGDGCPIDIDGDGTPTYYAGGGGGGNHGNNPGGISDNGLGGLGGGAGRNTGSYDATPNTGGGGAGGNAGKGGSGIVIVAY